MGAVDVVPIVYLSEEAQAAPPAPRRCSSAIGSAASSGVPVFLYGELTGSEPDAVRTRAQLRRGGVAGLMRRMAAGGSSSTDSPDAPGAAAEGPLSPDFGPARVHPSAGAALVAARPPLVAFNLQLAAPADPAATRARSPPGCGKAASEGLPGVRAIGLAARAAESRRSR